MSEILENEKEKILEMEVIEEKKNEEEVEEHFYNIIKMNCDYTTYKLIRSKHNLDVVERCRKCNKKFKDNDELYSSYLEEEKKNCIICKKCAKKE